MEPAHRFHQAGTSILHDEHQRDDYRDGNYDPDRGRSRHTHFLVRVQTALSKARVSSVDARHAGNALEAMAIVPATTASHGIAATLKW